MCLTSNVLMQNKLKTLFFENHLRKTDRWHKSLKSVEAELFL